MAAPELRLNVTLDLAAFRTQLGKLAQTSASHFYPVKLTIDQRNFKLQLAQLSKIKPVININDSQLEGARARIGTLNKSLATLRRATATPIEIKLKYVEVGKPSSAAAGQIGRAVSGGVRGSQALEGVGRSELLNIRKMMSEAGMALGKITSLSKATASELRASIVPAFTNSGEQAVNGLAIGLKDSSSKIGKIAGKVGVEAVNGIKDALGIASPSRVFKQIGEFSVDGLELGFLNGLKDFKSKSVAEIRKIVALMQFELAKVSGVSMAPGMSRSAGSRGSNQFMSPIGPLPEGSREPWAFSQYRYQPFMAQPGQTRGAGVPSMRERFPFAAAPSIMGTTTSPSMFGASFPALPSAGMTGGNAVRQAQLQSRMAAAYTRSAAREASVLGESQMYASVSGRVPLGNTAPRLPAGNRGGALALRDAGAQTPLSLDYYKNAFKYSEALKVADASMRNFSASQIPLIGGIKNLAGEFGQAAKQVLLYGTAYKGLAFLTSLPGQILNAAKSQQQFTNGLKTATQDTGTFAKELLYVDNVQRAFGLNLETTRTGFTRLYASMAPTGFDSGSIEKLFTGISAATASLQLTPDKAERVIYAFGQMASKGQIMSEELKGQLGDVLPGALAIFAKSAGMSVKEFSKAMEDGEFVGKRFREVFAKVSDELMNRFGTGAQAAGKSLQGLINTVGGDFQRTLESFSPLANSAAQAILGPLGGSLKQLALSAQIATGEIERVFMQLKESQQELKDLQDSAGTDGIITADEARQIKAAEQNVAALTAKYKSLQQAASDPAIAKQAQDITKFTEELGKAGTFVMNVAKTIGGMLSPVLNFLGTNLTTVISLITSFYIGFQAARLAAMALMGVLLLYRTLSAILGFGPAALGANALAAAFNGLGIAATGAQVKVIGLRLALTALVASTVIGAVVGGIMLIAGAFASMRDRANEASQSSRDAAKAAIDAAQTGGVAQAAMSVQTILGESRKSAAARKALEGIMARSTKAQRAGIGPMSLTMEESVALKGSSLTEKMVKPAIGGKPQMQVPSKGDADAIIRQFGSVAGQQDLSLREAKSALATAQRVARETGQNIPDPTTTTQAGDGSAAAASKLDTYNSPQLDFLQAQLEKQKQSLELQRINNLLSETAYKIQVAELELESAKLQAAERLRLAKLAINKDNLSAGDKVLAIKNAEIAKENELSIAQNKRNIAVAGATKELEGPFNDAIYSANFAMIEQQMLLENLKGGIEGLAPEQQAYLQVLGLTKDKSEDELAILEKKGMEMRDAIERQIALNREVERGKILLGLSNQLTLARTLDPSLELREQIRQRDPLLTAGEIEEEALLQERVNAAQKAKEQLQGIASTIGNAFGEAFKGIITGSITAQEALAGMFQSIADSFADMVAQMLAEFLKAQLIKGFLSLFPGFGGGGLGSSASNVAQYAPLPYANGGLASGGFTAFANGGMVTGPTLGLVGEGRYNEAIIPLPDGKSVPVQLSGGAGGNAAPINTNIVVNVKNGQAESQMSGNQGNQLARELEGAVRQVILKESRPGGLISSSR